MLPSLRATSAPVRNGLMGSALCFLFLTGLVPAARAGAPNVGCRAPFVFSNAAVNAVILPYTYSGISDKPLSATGQRLSALIYLNTLFSILKFESVGAVQLVALDPRDKAECTDAIVLDKLLGRRPGARAQIRPGNGLVMLWGRIYEESGEIYVQSYVRFQRSGVTENVRFSIGQSEFSADLASQAITLPPRKLSTKDLEDIQQEFVHSVGVRDTPDPQAPSRTVPIDTSPFAPPFAYSIVEVRGDWMKVEPFESLGPGGWIHAGFGAGRWPLRDKMPELRFVEGLVGYLAYRRSQALDPNHTVSFVLPKVADAFRRYDAASEGQPSPLPSAVEKQILGMLKVLPRAPLPEDVSAASALFREAYNLIPENAASINMMACGELWTAWVTHHFPMTSEKIVDDLIAAVALDPKDETVLRNLQNLYNEIIISRGPQPELIQRRDAIGRLRESARANPNH